MNYKQLTDEYLQATNKARWVKVTAKKYGVAGSDIICELMKSGYKYAELKRVNESQYNSAVNKYHKWQEEGCPATELIPVEQEEKPEEKKKETKVEIKPETEGETVPELVRQVNEILTLENEITRQQLVEAREAIHEKANAINAAKVAESEEVNRVMDQCTIESLSEAVERLEEENESLKGAIDKKDASINHLLMENADLKKSLYEKIQELHKKSAIAPETEGETVNEEVDDLRGQLHDAMDLVRTREEKIEELEKKIKHLKTSDFNSTIDGMVSESKLSTANERIKELEKELSFYEDEKDGDGIVIEELKATNDLLNSKLKTCEQYILNLMVYEV